MLARDSRQARSVTTSTHLASTLLALAPPGSASVFSPSSVWNARLKPEARLLHDRSITADLVQQVRSYGAWVNTTSYSTPVYAVGEAAKRVRVRLDARYAPLRR